jgi:peptidoglycan hydrolase-like amidase
VRLFTCLLLVLAAVIAPPVQPARAEKAWDAPPPQMIRIAIRESRPGGEPDPQGRILYVQTVHFKDYVKNVLPLEWLPDWHPEALKAGAIAVKMLAWYHTRHPTTVDGFTFDVDNTVNFQRYREGLRTSVTDRAVDDTWNLAYVAKDGEIFRLTYRSGQRDDPDLAARDAGELSQWGSQYWAQKGKTALQILQFFARDRILVPMQRR